MGVEAGEGAAGGYGEGNGAGKAGLSFLGVPGEDGEVALGEEAVDEELDLVVGFCGVEDEGVEEIPDPLLIGLVVLEPLLDLGWGGLTGEEGPRLFLATHTLYERAKGICQPRAAQNLITST